MEFLKQIRRRSFLSEVVYIILNVVLTVLLLVSVRVTGSIWLALLLVILSKWRVFAVRPRYWFANMQADLVSMIVSLSYVIFLYTINMSGATYIQILATQLILAALYVAWLLFLKPQSRRIYIIFQAGTALFFGTAALYSISFDWIAAVVVLAMWLIGYATARHIIKSYDEESHVTLLSMTWGVFLAEIGWLAYHWTIAYPVPFAKWFMMPQISILAACFGFLASKAYDSYYHHQVVRMNDILLPLLFTLGIVLALLLFFNSVAAITI